MRHFSRLVLSAIVSVSAPGLVISNDCAAPCTSYEGASCPGCAPTPTCETQTISRPFFSWQKININTRDIAKERCGHGPSPQVCCQAQPVMAVPQMALQPVQVQMTAYQPVAVQASYLAPTAMSFAPQAMTYAAPAAMSFAPAAMSYAAPQVMSYAPAPQAFVAPPAPTQFVAASTPAPQAAPDTCDPCVLRDRLKALSERVDALQKKMGDEDSPSVKELNERLDKHDKQLELQTQILEQMKTYFEKNPPAPPVEG